MTQQFDCPNRPFPSPAAGDTMSHRGTCSYCGSLDPDVFMARLEAGDMKLIPTDKAYKVYVENLEGAILPTTKFYFAHLSEVQRARFIELHNEGKLTLGFPCRFYQMPFFATGKPQQDLV